MTNTATPRQIAAERAWRAAEENIWEQPSLNITDAQFATAAAEVAAANGLGWRWEWDDELIPVWIDGDSALWSDGESWIASRR